jgi:hypothetical protein
LSGGEPLSVTFHHQEYDVGAVVHLELHGGQVDVYLSPEQFTAASTRGVECAVRDCLSTGWTYQAPARWRAS